jgi:RNA:NAD 2'-phosphotransferase (TPT1/KptA family)/8-oxo-dGTP pyrophosphatase MutT (NUDIX family)
VAGLDPVRLSRTLAWLLRHGASPGLAADAQGWFAAETVARACARTIRRPVLAEDVLFAITRFGGHQFCLEGTRIRMAGSGAARGEPAGPDLLFHATCRSREAEYRREERVRGPGGGEVHLSRTATQAWRVAHRCFDDPEVLVVDAARGRRDGLALSRGRNGLYVAPEVPVRHVMNLREGFAEQVSAGGFVVEWSTGAPRIALIRVVRRHGSTWEVAKGKLEAGEHPAEAAVREVREEMGMVGPLVARAPVAAVQYAFYTREGEPRLKTVYLYLLEVDGAVDSFSPAREEGVEQVCWFDLPTALDVLAHPSLRTAIGRLVQTLDERALQLGLPVVGEAAR